MRSHGAHSSFRLAGVEATFQVMSLLLMGTFTAMVSTNAKRLPQVAAATSQN